MLDIKYIRDNTDLVKKILNDRRMNVDIDELLVLDRNRRKLQKQTDDLRSQLKKGSKSKPTAAEIEKLRNISDEIKKLVQESAQIEDKYHLRLHQVPNLVHPAAPIGGEEDYKILEQKGEPPVYDFPPKDHEELMKNLDLIDFERGAKVAGAKFYYSKNDLVRLNFALLNYGVDILSKHGFTLVETPDLARNEILTGIGFNPRGPETQVYSIENTDISLIGTAEITMGGFHADEVLDLQEGPLKYAALSHCFRTEAGSYGRETKGLYRVHQFTKLEMFVYCRPDESEKIHLELLEIEKQICNGLDFPYRVIECASGDLGAPAYRKYDIEAWMVMKNGFGEITSTSNTTDYQSRRLNTKYRKPDGSTDYAHMLNGTAVVLSRFPIAIFENNQLADGSVLIPNALRKYMNQESINARKANNNQ